MTNDGTSSKGKALINVVVDTTAFRNDPQRKSAAWKSLFRLAETQQVQIHISDISRREFVTHREQEFDAAIGDAKRFARKLGNIVPEESGIADVQTKVAEIESRRGQVSGDFDNWLAATSSKVHAVEDRQTSVVLDAYFSGTPPFSKLKSRDDFPDAFIYQMVVGLRDQFSDLCVVTGDKNLGKTIEENDGLTVYQSIDDFVKSEPVSVLATRMANLDWFLSFTTSPDGFASDQSLLRSIEEQLPGQKVEDFQEDYEATIEAYGDLVDLEINEDGFYDYGNGVFSIPFTCGSECIVEYFLPKFVYHGLRERAPNSVEDWNDHVFRVDQYHDLKISGRIAIEILPANFDRPNKELEDWALIFESAKFDIVVDEVQLGDDEFLYAIRS